MRQLIVLCASILAGCQTIIGLDEIEVERRSEMSTSDAAADGVSVANVATARGEVSMPRVSPALDAGAVAKAAAGAAAAGRPAAPPRAVDAGAISTAPDVAGSGATGGDDAGVDTGVDMDVDIDMDIEKMLGNTNLRVSDILGYYSGEWGQMVLRAQGDEIRGVYEHHEGAITGQINAEGVFVGWWTQSPTRTGTDAGEVEFRWSRIADTSIALDGRWRYGTDGDWLENWDILRVTERSAPSHLTDRFNNSDAFKRHP